MIMKRRDQNKQLLTKYTVVELWDMYQERKAVLSDYTLDDLFESLIREELRRMNMIVGNADADPAEGDRGSHQDQAPEDFQ